ncbi:MAG: serine hydrolase [Bacteroidota bacterium]
MKKNRCFHLVLLLITGIQLINGSSLSGQTEKAPPRFIAEDLDAYIQKAMDSFRIPGVAICIVKDGKIIVGKGYGVLEINKPGKVDANTLFMIGSNTKAFTGTAAALLEFENQCSLNDKIIKWLPDFSMQDQWVAKEVSLNDALSHRIGMEAYQGDFMYWLSDLPAEEVIRKFGQLTPRYPFRSQMGYTNVGYVIAGKCIEKISGMSWADFLRKRFFEPLQMDRTLALTTNAMRKENVARAHTLVNDTLRLIPNPDIDNIAPCGSICSSASDMSHWLMCQLDSGNYNDKEVLPFQVIQNTRNPRTIIGQAFAPFGRGHFDLYGLGWRLTDYSGTEVISHGGAVDGFTSSVTLLPKEDLGFVILTNSDKNMLSLSLKWEIIDAYLNLPFTNYSDRDLGYQQYLQKEENDYLKTKRDTILSNPKPALDLSQFTGRYTHSVYGWMNISRQGNTLIANFEHHPKLTGTLECLGGKRFLCTYSIPSFGTPVIRFEIENGKVISMTLVVNENLDSSTYKFIKASR